MGDIINAGADLLGFGPASKQADATESAARMGAESQRYAADIQRQMYDRGVELQEPWRQAGMTALNKLIPAATDYQKFTASQFQADPGYAFRLAEGQKALERSAAARGGLISGSALKAATRYGQDMGSQEYQNAFNRYQTERNALLNPLQSLAGLGQTSANTQGAAASNYGTNAANLAMVGGANQANALMAGGNIRASQYGTLGRGIDQLYDYGNKNNWWSSGANNPGTSMSQQDYAIASGGY